MRGSFSEADPQHAVSLCVAAPSELSSSPETPQFMPVATCDPTGRAGMTTGTCLENQPVVHQSASIILLKNVEKPWKNQEIPIFDSQWLQNNMEMCFAKKNHVILRGDHGDRMGSHHQTMVPWIVLQTSILVDCGFLDVLDARQRSATWMSSTSQDPKSLPNCWGP